MDASGSGSLPPPATCRTPLGARCRPIDEPPQEMMMKNVALYVAMALLAAACASTDKKDAPVSDRTTAVTPPTTGTTGSTSRPTTDTGVRGDPLHDPSNILSK